MYQPKKIQLVIVYMIVSVMLNCSVGAGLMASASSAYCAQRRFVLKEKSIQHEDEKYQ